MTSRVKEIREADITHRKQFEEFVLRDGDPTVSKLIHLWNYWNKEFFDNSLKVCPIILLAEPSKPAVLGDYSRIGAYGSKAQIRIRPSLMSGSHPHMRPGKEYEKGRFLYVADVTLHETTHHWQDEVMGDLEDNYHGHGPLFRDKCNQIGERLGLPPVRTCKKRGKDAELFSCSYFPYNVRPPDYYLGAYIQGKDKPRPLRRRLERLLKDYSGDEIIGELRAMGILDTGHQYKGREADSMRRFSHEYSLRHEWFVDVFFSACGERGITADLKMSPSHARVLDTWLDEKLTRGTYLGANFFPHEKESSLKEKLSEIVSLWESIEISFMDRSVAMPPLPDLEFLISNLDQIFTWISDQRTRQTEAIMNHFRTMDNRC